MGSHLKIAFQLFAFTILLAGCSSVPTDSQVRTRLVGDWTGLLDNLELTLYSDGNFVSTFTRRGLDYKFEGTWELKNGFLIYRITANDSMNAMRTNAVRTMHAGDFDTYTLVYVDSAMLVCESANGMMRTYVRAESKTNTLK
jgi:hypothetical protein